jgi:hypothetical protein
MTEELWLESGPGQHNDIFATPNLPNCSVGKLRLLCNGTVVTFPRDRIVVGAKPDLSGVVPRRKQTRAVAPSRQLTFYLNVVIKQYYGKIVLTDCTYYYRQFIIA